MFYLSDGKPVFYIGKINEIGYITEEEKEKIIQQLKEDNPHIEIKDKPIEIDRDLKEKAIELGKLQLTYSKSEFMKYLNDEKPIPGLEVKQLKKENENLKLSIGAATMEVYKTLSLMEEQNKLENAKNVMDILELIKAMGGDQ